MKPRFSNNSLEEGDTAYPKGTPLSHPEVNFMLATDWGVLQVKSGRGEVRWVFKFSKQPEDWDLLESWLGSVTDVLKSKHDIECPTLAEACLQQIKSKYPPGDLP